MSLLEPPVNKFDFFNVRSPATKAFGIRQLKAFWLWSDVSYANDGADFDELPPEVQKPTEMVIGFFFSSDGIVFINIGENFAEEIPAPEVKFTYSCFETMELIHAESYGLQLDSFIRSPSKKKALMEAITGIPSIKGMADWAMLHMDRETHPLIERLVAFLCVEGIFFSSPFAFIFWLRKYYPKKLLGIVAANDLISRDENLHCEFAVHLINTLKEELKMDESKAIQIIQSGVEVALEFVKEMLPVNLLDMNVELMSRHVKSVANRWAQQIGLPLLYPDCKVSPFKFIENLSLEVKKNFFEKDATEYQKAPNMDAIAFDIPLEDEDF